MCDEQQDDAALVSAAGKDIQIRDDDAGSVQEWRIPARAECMSCHGRAAGYVLGVTELQMDRNHKYGSVEDNQLRTLEHMGLISGSATPVDKRRRLINPQIVVGRIFGPGTLLRGLAVLGTLRR